MVRGSEPQPSRHGRDPVAITGAACRLPGASDVGAFWDLLLSGRDVFSGGTGGHSRRPAAEALDAGFFGIPDDEAARIPAPHRLLMETTWDALADAGLRVDEPAAGAAGVYTVLPPPDLSGEGRPPEYGRALAARISHRLRLRGPCVDLTEGGTTSLLGVHLACRALWSGEIDLAVVGAVNPLPSPDGRPGTSGGEGVFALVLRRLSCARREGDRVYATILGAASAKDRAGLTPAQGRQATLRAAYRDAGVSPGEVDYVELHGGGTGEDDIAELTTLGRVLGASRPPDRPCRVGSAGANAGHATAGLSGLLRTALALCHRRILATPYMDRPGQAAHGFSLTPTPHTLPWPGDGPGLAGVSSFGGGIFVHVILGAPPRRARAADPERPDAYLLPLSARDPGALRRLAGAYAGVLAAEPAPDPLDVCFTAGARRTHHDHRMAVVGAGRAELVAALREGPAAHPEPPAAGAVRAAARPRVVFVFPGQGAHWVGMGRGLLRSSPVFARWIRECGRAVQDELGWSPADRLESGGPLSAVDEVQPTVWAVQVALAEVWRHWGIAPDMVIGHSMGEIAAATVAGALTIGDGAAVVCRRGRLLRERAVPGAMWAVRLTEREAQEAIGEHAGQVCAGVLNSRTSTVLSGDPGALAKVTEPLLARGVFCRRVKVDYASHAPQVEPMRAGLLAALADVRPRPAVVPMHSTAWSRPVDGPELGAAYWMENLRRPVRFGAAVRSVLAGGTPTVFVEVSAHPLLIKPVEEAIEEATATAAVVGSLYRRCPDLETLLAGLGAAYAAGCDPDWSRLHTGGRLVSLPGYPWARTDLGRAEAVSTP